MDNIERLLYRDEIFQNRIIQPEQISFRREVVEACKKNYCGRYGSCWTCPPGIGSLDEIKKRFTKYKSAFVFTTLNTLSDSFDLEGINNARVKTTALLGEICSSLRENGVEFTALGCGSCDICKKCTYPDSPCRFPEKAIPAVEACGIDVVSLAADIGINYHNGENTVTFFCIIFY